MTGNDGSAAFLWTLDLQRSNPEPGVHQVICHCSGSRVCVSFISLRKKIAQAKSVIQILFVYSFEAQEEEKKQKNPKSSAYQERIRQYLEKWQKYSVYWHQLVWQTSGNNYGLIIWFSWSVCRTLICYSEPLIYSVSCFQRNTATPAQLDAFKNSIKRSQKAHVTIQDVKCRSMYWYTMKNCWDDLI